MKADESFRKLITLHTRIMLLSDVFTTSGYQGRASSTLLQALVGPGASGILLELGSLHRTCVWDNILLKSDPVFSSVESMTGGLFAWSSLVDPQIAPTLPSTPVPGSTLTEPTSATSVANGVQAQAGTTTSSILPIVQAPKKEGPKEQNARALKYLAGQIPNALASFFQGPFNDGINDSHC